MADLDDAGLSLTEFRVLAHICRRSGEDPCWAGIASIAKTCRINPKTARSAIKNLIKLGWVSEQKRVGKTSILTPRTLPKPIPYPNGYPTQSNTQHPSQTDTQHPSQMDTHEGVPKKDKKKVKTQPVYDLPFQTPKFNEAWTTWLEHRKEIKKPVTPQSAKMTLNKLANMNENQAIESINQSIRNGWTGIFPVKQDQPRPTNETFNHKPKRNGFRPFD